MPTRDATRCVSANDEEYLNVVASSEEFLNGLDGVRRATSSNLSIINGEAIFPFDEEFSEFETKPCGRYASIALLPRIACNDELHLIEYQVVSSCSPDSEMTEVRRIEGATEHTETPRCTLVSPLTHLATIERREWTTEVLHERP
jgi:hypothetical protein